MANALTDLVANGIAIGATIDPIAGNNNAYSSDAIDLREFRGALFILSTGVIDEAVDFKLQEAETSGGAYQDISGKAITQLAGVGGDASQAMIYVKLSELSTDYFFVKAVVTVANGTSSLISCVGLGLSPIDEPVSDVDLASVVEIVGGSVYKGATVKFFVNDFTPTKDSLLAAATISVLGSAGVPLNAWEGPITLPSGRYGMHHDISAIAGPSPTSETLYGLVVIDTEGTGEAIHWELFEEPITIVKEGDAVVHELVVPLPQTLVSGY